MISNEFIKGSLKTIIIKLLKVEGPMHGYLLTQRIEAITGGAVKLTDSALYPVLHRLKKDKIVVTASEINNGRMRIHYALTPKGHSLVAENTKQLKELIGLLQTVVDLKPAPAKS